MRTPLCSVIQWGHSGITEFCNWTEARTRAKTPVKSKVGSFYTAVLVDGYRKRLFAGGNLARRTQNAFSGGGFRRRPFFGCKKESSRVAHHPKCLFDSWFLSRATQKAFGGAVSRDDDAKRLF